jgi:hypothetical protein
MRAVLVGLILLGGLAVCLGHAGHHHGGGHGGGDEDPTVALPGVIDLRESPVFLLILEQTHASEGHSVWSVKDTSEHLKDLQGLRPRCLFSKKGDRRLC